MRHLILALALVACGGGNEKPPENPTPTPTPTASASATPTAEVAWKDMTHEQKLGVMKNKVMPKMSEDFQAFDAKKYGDFGCKTCHGDGAKDGSFKMPNPALPKLPAEPAGFKALMD